MPPDTSTGDLGGDLPAQFQVRPDRLVFVPPGSEHEPGMSDLAPAIATLNKCTRDLAAEWGFDESYADRLISTPVWSYVSDVARRIQEKYPARALSRGAQANFEVRIIVGTDGRPERCDWINETKADDFEMGRTPCDIVMEDAEFEPAIDLEDQPIRSIYQSTIRYRIP